MSKIFRTTILSALLLISLACITTRARTQDKLVTQTGPRDGVIVIFDLKEIPESPQTKKEEPPVINLDELEKAGARIKLSNRAAGSIVVVEGAVYLTAGDTIIPMPGGGASGCFNPTSETAGRVERAKAKYAKLNAASQVK